MTSIVWHRMDKRESKRDTSIERQRERETHRENETGGRFMDSVMKSKIHLASTLITKAVYNLPVKPQHILFNSYFQSCHEHYSLRSLRLSAIFLLWHSTGRHVRSAWEVFSHLLRLRAEVNPKDHPFSGPKFSSLACVKVFIPCKIFFWDQGHKGWGKVCGMQVEHDLPVHM